MFNLVKEISLKVDGINNSRSTYSVFSSAVSEIGELGQEISIHNNDSYKQLGDDGVLGEIVDVIITLYDLIHVFNPEITEEEINEYAKKKLTKWFDKSLEHQKKLINIYEN